MIRMQILSPQGILFDGTVAHAAFPGEAGSFAVYPQHAPIVAALKHGNIVCFTSGGERRAIAVQSGFVEVVSNNVTACVEQSKNNTDGESV